MGSSKSSQTSATTNNSTQVAVGDGDNQLTVLGDTVNVDATNPDLIDATSGLIHDFIGLIKDNTTSSMEYSKSIADAGLSLAGRAETNDSLQWLYDMAKISLPVIAVILIFYFWSKKK